MKCYLAGPMRGIPAFNFPRFLTVAAELRAQGWEVFDPAQHDLNGGFEPWALTGHEDLASLGFDLRRTLAADLSWLALEADAIVLLPGWEGSKGAVAEAALAVALGLDAYEADPPCVEGFATQGWTFLPSTIRLDPRGTYSP